MKTKGRVFSGNLIMALPELSFRFAILFVTSIFLNLTTGCMYYYKVQTSQKITPQEIKGFKDENKYFVLHKDQEVRHLVVDSVNNELIYGLLLPLPVEHENYKYTKPNGNTRYYHKEESEVLSEVHLYVPDTAKNAGFFLQSVAMNAATVNKVEVYNKAKGATTASWVVPGVLGPILAIGAFIGIIALTKSSCPLVYVRSGNDYKFMGEIFGGAVYSSLERDDYLPLPGYLPNNGKYQLKISNRLPEVQYINLAELWIVKHAGNVTVLPDRQGNIHSISSPEAPVSALSSGGMDLLPQIKEKDEQKFLFNEEPALTHDTSAFNNLIMSFPLPENARSGKLVIHAGNSMWSDYTYGEFTKLFGNRYNNWVVKQGKEPAAKNIQWELDQALVMKVYLLTGSGWKFVDYFDMIGPLGARDLVMPLDLSDAKKIQTQDRKQEATIRIESGFKFWELDYAGMDFSSDTSFSVTAINPSSAINECGKNISSLISGDDHKYYIQVTQGEEGLLTFQDNTCEPGIHKSIFLHAKGYYEHVRDYPNSPDKATLLTFREAGRLSRFSHDNWMYLNNRPYLVVSNPNVP